MKLLWRGSWMDTPGYHVPDVGVLVDVELMLPLWTIENASARSTPRPRRKVLVFLMTDGPSSTFRKARTKRREPSFSGDFRVALVLGRSVPDHTRVAALAIRVPPAAQQVVVHRQLTHEVDESFSIAGFSETAEAIARDACRLDHLARQSYLHSDMEPPAALVDALRAALKAGGPPAHVPACPPLQLFRSVSGPARAASTLMPLRSSSPRTGIPVAVLGAGDYVRTETIAALRSRGFSLHCVADREPHVASSVARSNGFRFATTDAERAIAELPPHGLVVVATAHDSHAHLACLAAEAGHRVFLEKPPAVTPCDVARLHEVMRSRPGMIEIGYNRRYHPLVRKARDRIRREPGPASMTCTVKELPFLPDHWYFWANQGTRFAGNLCHWIDLAVFFHDDEVMPVSLTLSPPIAGCAVSDEERVLTVTFDDGSLFTILGTGRGDGTRGVQEQIALRRGATTLTIDDLWKMRVLSGGIERSSRTVFRNKAHTRMYDEAFRRVARGEPSTYRPRDMLIVSAIQIAAGDLIRSDNPVARLPSWLDHALADTSPSLREASADDGGVGGVTEGSGTPWCRLCVSAGPGASHVCTRIRNRA